MYAIRSYYGVDFLIETEVRDLLIEDETCTGILLSYNFV